MGRARQRAAPMTTPNRVFAFRRSGCSRMPPPPGAAGQPAGHRRPSRALGPFPGALPMGALPMGGMPAAARPRRTRESATGSRAGRGPCEGRGGRAVSSEGSQCLACRVVLSLEPACCCCTAVLHCSAVLAAQAPAPQVRRLLLLLAGAQAAAPAPQVRLRQGQCRSGSRLARRGAARGRGARRAS
jgi:hypothetical protein